MKTSLTLRVEKDQKPRYKAKAEAERTNLSTVGRQLLDAWLSGQISLNTTVEVGHVTVKEVE